MTATALTATASGFVNDGPSWLKMPPGAQAAYIQGVNDSSNFVYVNDDLATATVKLARTRCLIEQKITATMLASQITATYNANRSSTNQPPLAIYVLLMSGNCKNYINQERGRMGLPPI